VHVSDIATVAIKLPVGVVVETVTVEASSVQVETQTGTVSNIINGEQVRELPMNGRNFVQLTTLLPGAAVAENFDAKNKGLLAGVDISFSGAPANANQWRVDGANNNDIGSQRTILVYPSIDAIEEFKILRNSYGPEFGGAGGAQINIVTRAAETTSTAALFILAATTRSMRRTFCSVRLTRNSCCVATTMATRSAARKEGKSLFLLVGGME